MRKKRSKSILAGILSFALLFSQFSGLLPMTASAAERALEDGVVDEWVQDEATVKGGEVIEVTNDGWLHLKSSTNNGNGTDDSSTSNPMPAVFLNNTIGEQPDEGYVEFTLKPAADAGTTRFGVYLNYADPAHALFVGYDTGGWFWQKYGESGNPWYQGTRKAAPTADQEVAIRLEWADNQLTSATVNGEEMFTEMPLDYSAIEGMGNKIAIKAGSWSGSQVTDVYLKDIHYTGQKEAVPPYGGGVYDNWEQDPNTVIGTDAVNEVTDDGWLHLKAGSGNGNNPDPAKNPAVFINKDVTLPDDGGYLDVTLKSEQDGSKNRCGFYINYEAPDKGLFIGYDAGGWFWQRYGVEGAWYNGTRVAAPAAGQEVKLHLEWTATELTVATLDGENLFNNLPMDISDIPTTGRQLAFKAGTWSDQITDVYLKDIRYVGQQEISVFGISGQVQDEEGNPIEGATIQLNGQNKATTDAEGKYSINDVTVGSYTVKAIKEGYVDNETSVAITDKSVVADPIVLQKVVFDGATISSDEMDVRIDRNFPRVVDYTMKTGDAAGKVFYGQTSTLDTLRINNVDVIPTVTSEIGADRATYVMTVKDEANNIDAVLTAELVVEKNTLAFNITSIQNNLDNDEYPVQTIYIPNHSLISVRTTQENANLKGAKVSSKTVLSGDSYVEINDSMRYNGSDYMYAFISNNDLSAGLWGNAEYEGSLVYGYVSAGGSRNTRVMATVEDKGAYKSVGLGSTPWYYDRKITTQKGLTYVVPHTEMPSAKISIAADMNDDQQIDWQDGAIAFRDIMHNPYGAEEVPELVGYRIAMNFGSMAANPFLTTLDGVKKVSLNTDGLGQSVLLKGYGGEGHDSNHPDYGNIGQRIGGAEDMNTLMEEGAKYGARFGIHINADEMYTESQAFDEDLAYHTNGSYKYGWNWLDQGIAIDGLFDLASGRREARFDELKEKVGDNLDFIYLDVWGNQTSGNEDSWESRKIANQITSHGWRFTTEWGPTHEYDSTFQHWATDLTYGGYAAKGQNSEVMRFLRNHQKDSWVADYPSYSGAAQAPLLGGLNMKGFEGWSGGTDYHDYITVLYRHNLITKYLQHYKVMKWVDGEPVTMNGPEGEFEWTPEMEITLQDDAKVDTVVVTRGSNDINDLHAYRSRTITLNGRVISKGAPTGGDYSNPGDETYLIPWYWDPVTGDKVASDDEKLYHWNTVGGETSWELPVGWESLQNVIVYKLTDTGRTEETVIDVNDGWITLTAEAETPYVVYKGEQQPEQVEWSTGMHIEDTGFNSGNLDNWTKAGEGTAELAYNASQNPMLKLDGEVSMTQPITGLEAGKEYALYVGVDNRSDAAASMTVKSGDEVLATNFTYRSIVKNLVSSNQHNNNSNTEDGSSYFQNMYVFFTAPESGELTLTLSRAAGEGNTFFDDIRIVESSMNVVKEVDENGTVTGLENDFENNVQGIYPFVVSGPGGITDNRIHLSERHEPYTQAGDWGDKRVDDVLEGNWSVKINGLCSHTTYNNGGEQGRTYQSGMIYQTIPQNFHFEPGVTYDISFKYQLGSPKTYAVTYGVGEFNGGTPLLQMPTTFDENAYAQTQEFSFSLTGDESGQSWFGIYSTGEYADLKEFGDNDDKNGPRDFCGYKDFILDDLVIKVSDVQKGELQKAINATEGKYEQDYTAETWAPFAEALEAAQEILNSQDATQEQVDEATADLVEATEALVAIISSVSGKVVDENGAGIADAAITLYSDNLDPLSTTTDNEGNYAFENIFIRDYSAKVVKDGYQTIYGETVTPVAGETTTHDFTLMVKAIPDYYNYFDNGNVSSIENLAGNPSTVGIEAVEYDGSDALQLTFGSDRPSVVDTAGPVMKNGIFEADITPLDGVTRIGLTLRGNSHTERIYVGTGDSNGNYFWEYWTNGDNGYSGMFSGPMLQVGKTSHFKAQIQDDTLTLWVDGVKVIEADIPGMPDAAGYIGFNKRDGGRLVVDNIEVYNNDVVADTNTITGSVRDMNNGGIYNAMVALKDADGQIIATTKTDLNGDYHFKSIPYGSYTVMISKSGYATKTVAVEVTAESADAGITILDEADTVDKGTLEYILSIAKGHIDNGDVDKLIPEAKEMFMKIYNYALAVYNDPDATQDEVDEAWDALLLAIQGLDFVKGDTTELEAAIAEANALNETDYTPESWKVLADAVAAGQAIVDGEGSLQSVIDEATQAIKDAIAGLVEAIPPVDWSALEAALAEAAKLNESDYTAESWKVLADAVEAGKNLPETATQEQVDAAAKAITDAIAGLVEAPEVDRTRLKDAIDLAESYDLDKYVDDGKDVFRAALEEAITVYNDANATQAEVDAAEKALLDAMSKLRLRADKDSLEEWLDKLQQYDLSKYTDESVAAVLAAKAEAEALLAQDLDESYNGKIQEVARKLGAAINALELKDSGGSSSGDKPITTGDAAPVAALSVLAVAAAGAILMLKKKQK